MENAAISDCILRNSCANCDVIAKKNGNFATEVLFLMKSEQVREKLLKDNDYDTINNPTD